MAREYLMSMERYFGGEFRFMVTAENKTEAIEKAKKTTYYLHDDGYIKSSLRVVKKLKPSF